ncbi:fimbrial biogenesis outer membrane usher protein, partial [Nodosilinea sp. LEGE 07298]|uniref:fimbria/pilus outer membrane usher protein n=1 Tax=Nodosilinea sp. LEGE 07298 TaxID=2777970 RepID=UPI0018810A4D
PAFSGARSPGPALAQASSPAPSDETSFPADLPPADVLVSEVGPDNSSADDDSVLELEDNDSAPEVELAPEVEDSDSAPEAEAIPAQPPTSTTTDIFEEVFGRPRDQAPQQVTVPIILNDQPAGQGLVLVPGGSQVDVQVATDSFLSAVAQVLRPDIAAQLAAASQADGTLALQSIREVGIAINFDSSQLELQVGIPPALRQTAVVNAGSGGAPPELAQALPPSAVSGYLNLRGSQAVVWSGTEGSTGRQPLALNFDGAINVHGWVFESSLGFTEGGAGWRRGSTRLVHDDTATAIRYQIGDVVTPVRGYQASLPTLGVAVVRNFSLQPYQITRPISRFEFFLERLSTVEVFINGQSVQTLRLDPGPQDVRNLPLQGGINGVQLVITDDLGRVQQLDFATGVSGDLLAPGVQQFAYSLGFPASGGSLSSARGYDFSQPTLSLSHRMGLSDNLTLGGYLQGDLSTQMVGIEGTWATTVGNFGWDAALSLDQAYGLDGAARLYYDWFFQGATSADNRSLRLATEYRGANFMTVADGLPNNNTGLDVSLTYSQTFFENMRTTLSGRYQVTRNQPSDAYSIALGISRPIARGLSLNASASYGINAQGQAQPRMYVGLSASLPQQRQFINTATTLDNNGLANRVNWAYSSPVPVGGISTALTATTRNQALTLLSQTRYQGYRADLTLDHTIDMPRNGSGAIANTTRVTWGTALVFADGVFGWSRPIDNSFAIVARQGTAQGSLVQVNPSSFGDIARADALGPGVVPLSPYTLTTLAVDAPDLPLGSDLGDSSYQLFPTYRSGTLIRVGSEATVLLRGVLVDEQGNPLALQHGRIVSLSDPDWPAVELITNRTGRFAAQGLNPGRYEIRLFGREAPVSTFEIPADTTGVYTLGNAAEETLPEAVVPEEGL